MDKIKINIGYLSLQKLRYDAETFNFSHKDETVNLNSFINTILVNMYELRKETVTARREYLTEKLQKTVSNKEIDEIASHLMSLNSSSMRIETQSRNEFISLRPTKNNEAFFESVALNECKDNSLSSFLYLLLEEYLHLDQSEREIIALKKEKEMIARAIKEELIISFLDNTGVRVTMRPFGFGSNEDNSFNYVFGLFQSDSLRPFTVHLYKLRDNLVLLNKHFVFSKEEKIFLSNSLVTKGIQYVASEFIKAKVWLDKFGVKMLRHIYYNRPYIESLTLYPSGGGEVVLSGSSFQIESYIYRLQEHAFILSPLNLSENICLGHRKAYSMYAKRLNIKEKKK